MIQVYKKNELFIIENTVTDIIYPNLTREEALVLLKKFNRNEPEHRCNFAIKEDNISFEYVSLGDKDKIISDLEAKLAESNESHHKNIVELTKIVTEKDRKIEELKHQLEEKQSKIQELNDMYEDLLVAKGTENELMQVSADCDFFAKENRELKQQLAEKENTITNLIEDSNASKELLKKQLNEQTWLCEEFRFQLEEKDNEIEKLTEELDDKNFCKDFVDLYSENKLKTQMLHKNWKDKISFALEQLEKVKEWANDYYGECSAIVITHFIDNQIEELKKGVK